MLKGVILDLDGVVTHTAKIHAAAWKKLFDEYNERRTAKGVAGYEAFDVKKDYLLYVDGKARQDGVHGFLESRGVHLPMGTFTDSPDAETCHGLGNRKDRYFKDLLLAKGPEVFDDAVIALEQWRQAGFKTAIASSSRNCEEILRLAGLTDLFDVRVDGTHLQEWDIPGKPAPDLFLAAARNLDIHPEEAALFEDAISGIEAGRRGGFGLVIGVARHGSPETLLQAGADCVVEKLTEISLEPPGLGSKPQTGEQRKLRRPRA